MDNNTKVLFVQEIEDGVYETESIWCQVEGEYFVIDNIPFIAKNISLGDTVKAEYDADDDAYYFEEFVKTSGNSTVRIIFNDYKFVESTREWLNKNKCESEAFPKRSIIAVNIPKEINYKPVKAFLDDGEQNGNWTYEESCLEHEY